MRFYRYILLLFLLCLLAPITQAQTTSYFQFWNEFALTRPLGTRWSAELNLGDTWSSSPNEHKDIFSYNAQLYARGWAHYYFNSRWKFSAFAAYYYNRDVPEIDQNKLPEIRLALQGTYYFHKVGYTLLSRTRIEDRNLDADEDFQTVFRFREQIKLLYPINSMIIRKGVFFAILSEEIYLKTKSDVTGSQFFDRNRLTAGLGYSFTDDLQMELTYANEFLPRGSRKEVYNAIQLNITFNNLFPHLKRFAEEHHLLPGSEEASK